jgi:hypothetical protein
MTRHVVGTLIVVLCLVGCAVRPAEHAPRVASAGYQLIHPPAARDDHYPGGFHVQAHAPVATWQRVAVFPTREECESSRIARIDDSIDAARVTAGDKAKYQLPVRQAVNARCVSSAQ